MSDREIMLKRLVVGDIFHATFPSENPGGPSLVCLIESTTATSINSRTVTTQRQFQFDRQTGEAEAIDGKPVLARGDDNGVCIIDSVAPLPVDIHNVMLGIDRKFRLARSEWFDKSPERFNLDDAEKKAIIFISSYYPANPL